MSLLRSWLPSRPKSTRSSPNHELPLFNSPTPTDEQPAFPPPLLGASMHVAASIHASSPMSSDHGSPMRGAEPKRLELPTGAPEGMLWLQRREIQLEQKLHELLDAQSDALLAGISGPPQDGAKPVDLIAVRRDIYKRVRQLTAIKADQESLVRASLQGSRSTLQRLESWDQKRNGLIKEIDTIRHEDVVARTRTLQTEADKLQNDIIETEQKLNRMRQRHGQLLDQISQIENSVQSRLSTYTASLNILEDEINAWLARPPSPSQKKSSSSTTDADFYSLQAGRRTLELARDHWREDYKSLERDRRTIRKEKRALEQGALVWKEVITEISTFENHLSKEVSSNRTSPDNIAKLLARMDDVLLSVEQKLELAANKGWKLLVVCIGAELEAFRQGRGILQQASNRQAPPEHNPDDDLLASAYESSQSHIRTPDKSSSTRQSRILTMLNDDDDSDDGPDPALLIGKRLSESE